MDRGRQLRTIAGRIRHLINSNFFGEMVIKFDKGNIVYARETQGFTLDEIAQEEAQTSESTATGDRTVPPK